jgi:hypothetical protein
MTKRSKLPLKKIHALRGSLKRKPGHQPFAEEWAEHKREEMALAEAKFARSTGSAAGRNSRNRICS